MAEATAPEAWQMRCCTHVVAQLAAVAVAASSMTLEPAVEEEKNRKKATTTTTPPTQAAAEEETCWPCLGSWLARVRAHSAGFAETGSNATNNVLVRRRVIDLR